jgi:hypothetical protein
MERRRQDGTVSGEFEIPLDIRGHVAEVLIPSRLEGGKR